MDSPITSSTARFAKLSLTPTCPLPKFSWGDNNACWNDITIKDDLRYKQLSGFLNNNPEIKEYHRAVVIEWLSEVTSSYRMRRDTFYAAVTYFDTFLSKKQRIQTSELQALGSTCLFTASKIEEIYHPPCHEFAEVTGGVCTLEQIINIEWALVDALRWNLTCMTPFSWLLLLMQLTSSETINSDIANSLTMPLTPEKILHMVHFDHCLYIPAVTLLDLCVLSSESNQYPARTLAAAVLLTVRPNLAGCFSFLDDCQLMSCARFVGAFASSIHQLTISLDLSATNFVRHFHVATLDMYKTAQQFRDEARSAETMAETLLSSPKNRVQTCLL